MKASRIVSTAALIALIGGPGAGQKSDDGYGTEGRDSGAGENANAARCSRDRLTEVGHRLQEARPPRTPDLFHKENTSRRSMRSREANTETQ